MGILKSQKTINKVVLLPISDISASPFQPRRHFDRNAMEELARSIEANGLLQPVTVRRGEEGKYELIAGERRLLACQMIKMDKIPAIIENYGDNQSAMFALIENLQRKDLNYFEEAQGIQTLMEQCAMTQQQIAKQLGKAQSTIANKLRLLAFQEDLREKIMDGGLTERHARALLRLEDKKTMEETVDYIVKQRLNVGETEKYIDNLLMSAHQPEKSKATRLFIVKDLRVFFNTISKAVSTMKLAGIEVNTTQIEDEEYINYTLRIPKKGSFKQPHTA